MFCLLSPAAFTEARIVLNPTTSYARARVKEDNLNGWSGGRKYGPSKGPVAGSSGFSISFFG